MHSRRFVFLAIGLLVCGPAFAVINTIDDVPAATLLLPYFEIDISNAGMNTLFSINNASSTAVLAHVTLWTDQSVPAFDFDVYLTGYDVQTIDLREIFVNGQLPRTASAGQDPQDTISPQGPLSQDINFASCMGMPEVDPALSVSFRHHLQAWFQGNQSPATGNCAGSKQPDTDVLRGYVTVDTVNACNLFFPSDWASYAPFVTDQNVLWGDYFYVNPDPVTGNFARGETLVHIEACPSCFAPGDHTFYGRYNGGSGIDGREPLPIAWAARYTNGGTFDGGTDFLVWREAGSSAAAYSCALQGPPSWYPLEARKIEIFDEQEQLLIAEECSEGDPPCEQQVLIPNEANRIDVASDLLASFDNGAVFLDLSHGRVTPIYGDTAAQSWVSVAVDGGSFTTGHDGVQLRRSDIDVTQAFAGNCWQITGWLDDLGQPSTGVVGDHANLVSAACVAPAPSGYAWLHILTAPDDLYVRISLSDSHVSGNYFMPLLLYYWESNGKPFLVVEISLCGGCTDRMAFVSQPGPCTRLVTWWTRSKMASFDGANCQVSPVPSGSTPFIYANSYYVASVPSTICQVGSYDGANCYVMQAPSGFFIWNNGFYTTAGPNSSCSVGIYDGANCFVTRVPPGSQAFIYNGAFYATTRQCAVGRYDGANCYLGTPPSTPTPTTAFINGGAFYYTE